MTEQEFNILKEEANNAVSNMLEMVFDKDQPGKVNQLAFYQMQLIGIRLLAVTISSSMFQNKNISYEEASRNLLRGLKKETEALLEECKNNPDDIQEIHLEDH